jgi:hypothetical protein
MRNELCTGERLRPLRGGVLGGPRGTGREVRDRAKIGMWPPKATVSVIEHERGCGDFEPAVR